MRAWWDVSGGMRPINANLLASVDPEWTGKTHISKLVY